MKKSEKSTVSKILRLPDEMNDRLKAMADDRSISQNEFILKAINAYLESNNNDDTIPSIGLDTTPKIGLDTMDSIIELIAPRFQALESKIERIEQQLKAIVASGTSPQKTPKKTTKTIAPGVGTIANVRIDWKSFIAEFPGKNLDELEEIAVQRYPEKEARRMRDSIGRRLKAKVKGKEA